MKYDIVLSHEAWDEFHTYTRISSDEIAAFGYCKPMEDDKGGFLYVDSIFLVPQEVSGSEVDFITEGLPFAVERALKDERIEDLRFCIHSHVNFGASFSSTDEDMIKKVYQFSQAPWFASAIFNKRGDTAGRVDVFDHSDTLPGIGPLTVEANVIRELEEDPYEEACTAAMKEHVTRKVYVQHWNKQTEKGTALVPVKEVAPKSSPKAKSTKEGSVLDAKTPAEALLLVQIALDEDWDYQEASDGVHYFWDQAGDYRGSAIVPDEVLEKIDLDNLNRYDAIQTVLEDGAWKDSFSD